MKKRFPSALVILTLLFAAFTAGCFLGRNYCGAQVQVSVPPALRIAVTQPSSEETSPPVTDATLPPVTFPIDLNTATARDLTALPGIGDVLAQRILAYRQEQGPFATVEELMNVEGIGEGRMEAIVDLVTIGG